MSTRRTRCWRLPGRSTNSPGSIGLSERNAATDRYLRARDETLKSSSIFVKLMFPVGFGQGLRELMQQGDQAFLVGLGKALEQPRLSGERNLDQPFRQLSALGRQLGNRGPPAR